MADRSYMDRCRCRRWKSIYWKECNWCLAESRGTLPDLIARGLDVQPHPEDTKE